KDSYLRYVDTAFWLRSEELMTERRTLLSAEGSLFTDALLEPVLPYRSDVPLAGVISELGLDPVVGEIVGDALFGEFGTPYKLRRHQAAALRHRLRPGDADERHVVVTSGTGSGKTESFLLPVLTRL